MQQHQSLRPWRAKLSSTWRPRWKRSWRLRRLCRRGWWRRCFRRRNGQQQSLHRANAFALVHPISAAFPRPAPGPSRFDSAPTHRSSLFLRLLGSSACWILFQSSLTLILLIFLYDDFEKKIPKPSHYYLFLFFFF